MDLWDLHLLTICGRMFCMEVSVEIRGYIEIVAEVQDVSGEWHKVYVRVSPGSQLGMELVPHIEEEALEASRDYGWTLAK